MNCDYPGTPAQTEEVMEKLIDAIAKVEALLDKGHRNSGMMGSELNLAKRELERAFGEFQRSY